MPTPAFEDNFSKENTRTDFRRSTAFFPSEKSLAVQQATTRGRYQPNDSSEKAVDTNEEKIHSGILFVGQEE